MQLLESATGPIAYDQRGEGPAIVLLASGAHDRSDYDELRALLPAGFRSLALDWPAHGESPPGEGPASVTRFADIAEEFVARLAPEGAVIVGNSVGGFAAARLAIRRPELVKGLVLIDSGGFVGRPLQVRVFCALMAMPWFLKSIYPSFSARYMRSRTAADETAREVAIATVRRTEGSAAVSQLWRSFAWREHDLRGEASAIAAPVLLIWGRRDPVIPVRVARRLAQTLHDARLVVLNTGHVPHTSDPDSVARELVRFAGEAMSS